MLQDNALWYLLRNNNFQFWVTWPLKVGNANLPLSRKPLEIEPNRVNFITLGVYHLRNYNFWKYWFWVTWPLKVTWPWKRKLSIISETVRDRVKWITNVWKFRFWVTWPFKVTQPQKLKLAIISDTLRDRAKRSKFWFWGNMTPQVTWPQKLKLDVILATVRDRAKRSKFSNPKGLIHTKLQLLKILIMGSHDPPRSQTPLDLTNVNWP